MNYSRLDFSRLCFAFGLGTDSASEKDLHPCFPEYRPKHAFRKRSGRWVYGDMMPLSSGSFISRIPFQEGTDVLVGFMFCSHDGVCDEPAMATLFFEGGVSGDIDDLAVIMIYGSYDSELAKTLDEMGLLFLCSDAELGGEAPSPYFPIGSMKTSHESFDEDIRIEAGFPIPGLEQWDESDVFGAYRIACIVRRLWSIEDDFIGYELGYTAAKLMGAFTMTLPSKALPADSPQQVRRQISAGRPGLESERKRREYMSRASARGDLVYQHGREDPTSGSAKPDQVGDESPLQP